MFHKASQLWIGFLLSILFTACWYSPVQVVPSSRNVPENATEQFDARHEGEACRALFLGFIPVSGDNRIETAMSNIVGDPDNGWLAEMTVETKTVFWILGFTECTIVTGYPQKMPDDAYDKLIGDSKTEEPMNDQPDDSAAEEPKEDQSGETKTDEAPQEQSDESESENAPQEQTSNSTAEPPAEKQSDK